MCILLHLDNMSHSCRWLLTPYRNTGHLTNEEKLYNTSFSRRRTTIERAFGVLKRRFRLLLLGIDMVDLTEIDRLIMAACVVHNICMLYDGEEDFVDDDHDDIEDGNVNPVVLHPVGNVVIPNNCGIEGRVKRINITNNLYICCFCSLKRHKQIEHPKRPFVFPIHVH